MRPRSASVSASTTEPVSATASGTAATTSDAVGSPAPTRPSTRLVRSGNRMATRRVELDAGPDRFGCAGEVLPQHGAGAAVGGRHLRSEEHTSELQSQSNLVCRLLLEKK